ncbi:polyisoprenoid-binding protein [bacterium]|nr:polyisoprenoid-binding protein [bacterium]
MKPFVSFCVVCIGLFLSLALPGSPALADTYVIDAAHSSVTFKVRHMMVSKVRGSFDRFEGWFTYDPEAVPATWRSAAVIDAASINTANERRDAHLRSPDFFEVDTYPTLKFAGTGVEKSEDGAMALVGDLTLHGVTKPVRLDLELGGTVVDPGGKTRAGFTAAGEINRKDFGIVWSKSIETGGLVVGEEVEIQIEVEGIRE